MKHIATCAVNSSCYDINAHLKRTWSWNSEYEMYVRDMLQTCLL